MSSHVLTSACAIVVAGYPEKIKKSCCVSLPRSVATFFTPFHTPRKIFKENYLSTKTIDPGEYGLSQSGEKALP